MSHADKSRVFLLLQGPMSYFFTYLGRALRAEGVEVRRIHVCPGDQAFWRGPGYRWGFWTMRLRQSKTC